MSLRIISEVMGVIVILAGAVVWYHENDNEGIEEAIAEMSLDVLKPKLSGLYDVQCQKTRKLLGSRWLPSSNPVRAGPAQETCGA